MFSNNYQATYLSQEFVRLESLFGKHFVSKFFKFFRAMNNWFTVVENCHLEPWLLWIHEYRWYQVGSLEYREGVKVF